MEQNLKDREYAVAATEFAEEILLLIVDCFHCVAIQKGKNAVVHFENGQRFRMTVEEID